MHRIRLFRLEDAHRHAADLGVARLRHLGLGSTGHAGALLFERQHVRWRLIGRQSLDLGDERGHLLGSRWVELDH